MLPTALRAQLARMRMIHRALLSLTLLLGPVSARADTVSLSPEQLEAAKEQAATANKDRGTIDSPAQRDRRVHGEVGVAVGTGGYRAIYGTAGYPIGDTGYVAVSLADQQGGYRLPRRR